LLADGNAPLGSSNTQSAFNTNPGDSSEMNLLEVAIRNRHFTMAAMVIALGGRFTIGRTLEQLQQLGMDNPLDDHEVRPAVQSPQEQAA
jgi:hypothetical protein